MACGSPGTSCRRRGINSSWAQEGNIQHRGQDIHGGFVGRRIGNERKRHLWDSNPRGETPSAEQADALTARPKCRCSSDYYLGLSLCANMLMGQSDPLARRPGMFAFKCKGEASALGSTSAVLGCSFFIPHRYRPPVNVLNMHVSKARQTNSDTNKQKFMRRSNSDLGPIQGGILKCSWSAGPMGPYGTASAAKNTISFMYYRSMKMIPNP